MPPAMVASLFGVVTLRSKGANVRGAGQLTEPTSTHTAIAPTASRAGKTSN